MPKLIQRKRTKGWRMPAGTISITRPGKWGNWIIADSGKPAAISLHIYGDSDKIIGNLSISGGFKISKDEAGEWYRRWLIGESPSSFLPFWRELCFTEQFETSTLRSLDRMRHRVILESVELRNHDLACWCHECEPYCHGNPLLEMANR